MSYDTISQLSAKGVKIDSDAFDTSSDTITPVGQATAKTYIGNPESNCYMQLDDPDTPTKILFYLGGVLIGSMSAQGFVVE